MVQDYTIKRSTGASARTNGWIGTTVAHGTTTTYKRTSLRVAHISGGGKAFAGVRDDPFFFDLPGFVEFKKQLLAGSTDLGVLLGGFTGVDTFKGTNVSSIAIEVPNARLGGTGKTVGIWATVLQRSHGVYQQVERMGRPAINTVFNNTNAEKEAANRLRPSDDRSFDRDNVIATMTAIDHVLEVNAASNYTAGRDPGHRQRPAPGHPDDQARPQRRLPQRTPAQRRRDQRRVLAAHPRQRHERWRQRQRRDVPGHVPLPRRTALTDPRPGPATGRSGTHHSSARPNAGTHRHMTTLSRHLTGLPRVPLAVLLLTVTIGDRRPGPAARPDRARAGVGTRGHDR